jgi:hypothetical protein
MLQAVLLPLWLGVLQPSQGSTAAEVAASFLNHINHRRWDSAAALVDSGFASRHKRESISIYREQSQQPVPSVQSILAADPEMPVQVAEYLVRRQVEMNTVPPNLGLWPGWTPEGLEALSPAQFTAVYLRVRDRREECERVGGFKVPDSLYSWSVLGDVTRGDTAYVVIRSQHPGRLGPLAPPETVSVIHLIRERARWLINSLDWFPGLPAGCGPVPRERVRD